MRRLLSPFVAVALLGCASSAPVANRIAYVGAHVWTGDGFERRDLVVENGVFVDAAASTTANQVDLAGAYLMPPFCEAHNHNLGSADGNEEAIAAYLRDGVYYVGILSNLPRLTDAVRHTYNTPTSVDVILANGPLTATGGHPVRLREFLLEQGAYPGFTRETLPGQGYFIIDTEADLERLWPEILALDPDIIKIALLYSEEYELRREDARYFGSRGLDPNLVPRIVERAHAAGLQVFAHVETAHDFHVAVSAGVDVIAHMPGYNVSTRIEMADARLAAARGVRVITTAVLIEEPRRRRDPEHYARVRAAQIENLRLLREAGVPLAVGSDTYTQTSRYEVAHLRGLGVFSNAELLRMWSTDCARTLFPNRRLGALEPGNEASFLALGGDPLQDFAATENIRLRIKQGVALEVPPAPAPEPQ